MIRNMEEFVCAFKAARRVSTPLVMVRTADPASSMEAVARVLHGQGGEAGGRQHPFFSNSHRFYADAAVLQGIWNLRDRFKASGRMLAVLTAPGATLPNELAQDVLVLDEPLPSAEDLNGIVRSVFSDAQMGEPDAVIVGKAVDALIGLAAFPAE